ncbi:MAG TPA: MAPEG family protein [Stellaceae bacterium]|nr:MAPEG family protein [Stellaceae bacterium]
MSPDLKFLVWSVALAAVQMVIAVLAASQQFGLPLLAGNRDGLPAATGMAGRAHRAHRNMLESLVLLAALVLVAQVTGKANAATALGAQLFFWARLAYAFVYLGGIPWVRTGVWAVSVVGLVMIFLQLI